MAAAIILAAGASRRLGSPKQLIRLGAETLLERTVRVALEAGLHPVYGVVAPDLLLDPVPPGMILVVNHQAAEGMAASIRAGLRALQSGGQPSPGAVILACDQPAVTAAHLQALAQGLNDVVASRYAGRQGVPAYFPARVFAELLSLQGDLGARDLLQTATAVDLPLGALDVDTVEDLERAQKLYST